MSEFPNVRYLCVVQEVYRNRRIGSAAKASNLSQPAATQSLAKIEEMLGVQLFERQTMGMVPTEAGILFEQRLSRILEHLHNGEKMADKKSRQMYSERVRSGFHRFCSHVQIRALLAVSKAGSFNQAARDIGVSQPGIHRAVRELAALSGLKLFDQTRGGIVLTAAAELLVLQLRLARNEFRQAVYEINELLGKDSTHINVGSLPLSRSAILPKAIHELLTEVSSQVQINCIDARYPRLLRDLRFGDIDFLIGALRYPKPADDIEQEELFTDSLGIIVAPGHPLAQRRRVSLEDTLEYPWVAPPKETPSGAYLFKLLRIHEMSNSPVRIVSSSLLLSRELLSKGNYVSIASKRQIMVEENMGNLVQLKVDLPDSERVIGITLRNGWSPTPIQKRFLDIIRLQF